MDDHPTSPTYKKPRIHICIHIYMYIKPHMPYIPVSLSIYIYITYILYNLLRIRGSTADMAEIPYQETRAAGYFWQKSEMALAASCLDFFEIWRYHGGIRIGIYIYNQLNIHIYIYSDGQSLRTYFGKIFLNITVFFTF